MTSTLERVSSPHALAFEMPQDLPWVHQQQTSTYKAPLAVPAGTAPGTAGLPWGNRGGPLSPFLRRAQPPLPSCRMTRENRAGSYKTIVTKGFVNKNVRKRLFPLEWSWRVFKITYGTPSTFLRRLTLLTSELACFAVRLMRLFKAISMAALILPVDVLAQVYVNPREINDFNVEPRQGLRQDVVVTSNVERAATPEEIAQERATLDKEIAIDPKNAKAYISRGLSKMATGDDTGAISDLRLALTLDPKNVETYNLLGEAQRDKKDYSGAVATYSHELTLDPKNPDIYNSRAWAKKEKGDFDGAIADFSHVIALDPPTSSRGYEGRGGAKFAKHDFDGAIADLTKVIELDPKNAAGAYGLRGNAKQSIGDLNGAKADWAASTHNNAH